jgi:hypothetical protein
MNEPVVLHHRREEGRWRSRRGAAASFNGLLGGLRFDALSLTRRMLGSLVARAELAGSAMH